MKYVLFNIFTSFIFPSDPEENVALTTCGAQVICGELRSALVDGDSKSYDLDRGFSRHPIDGSEAQTQGIVVCLRHPHLINAMRLLLWDRDQRSYSFYIEVSMNDKDYVTVVDHRQFLCRSWQHLRFPLTVAKLATATLTIILMQ